MRLPENGRLFVGGIAPSTGDADLRGHFRRFGEVADVCLPRDHITGRPRCFAFVQFTRPSDACRALADPHHVINGRQVCIRSAQSRQSERSSAGMSHPNPLHQRIYRVGKWCYRVGDTAKITIGPVMYDSVIAYISDDGERCWAKWPPVLSDTNNSARSGYTPSLQN